MWVYCWKEWTFESAQTRMPILLCTLRSAKLNHPGSLGLFYTCCSVETVARRNARKPAVSESVLCSDVWSRRMRKSFWWSGQRDIDVVHPSISDVAFPSQVMRETWEPIVAMYAMRFSSDQHPVHPVPQLSKRDPTKRIYLVYRQWCILSSPFRVLGGRCGADFRVIHKAIVGMMNHVTKLPITLLPK